MTIALTAAYSMEKAATGLCLNGEFYVYLSHGLHLRNTSLTLPGGWGWAVMTHQGAGML